MSRARRSATEHLNKYFRSIGYQSPTRDAYILMKRIGVDSSTHAWQNPQFYMDADELIRRSTIDTDDFVENYLGATLWVEDLRSLSNQLGCRIYGFSKPKSRVIVICETTFRYEPLRRATIFHEAGHLCLHRDIKRESLNYAPRKHARPTEEREADEFMMSCMLPLSIFHLATARVCAFHKIDLTLAHQAACSRRGRWIWRYRLLPEMVDRLCVSREMLVRTLYRLRFIDFDTLQYHLSYRMPNKWLQTCRRKPNGDLGPACRSILNSALGT